MGIIETLLIAIALSMDAFAVSIACGLNTKSINIYMMIKVGVYFGVFQAIMPLIGYYAGNLLPFDISTYDHWIAFGLLVLIGGHMVKESFDPDSSENKDYFGKRVLFTAAFATSIDALAAGFSASLLNAGILLLTVSAGVITLFSSSLGVRIGNRYGHIFEKKVELASGLVLILIGAKILIEHLFF